jgi:HK97 family phage major capsid protein
MQISFDGQILAADTETRTIKGLVVPFAKVGNTSAGPVRFEFGAFGEIDASQIVLNMEHDRTRPLGRGIAGSEEITPAGVSMAFKIAPTSAGNDALVEASEGLRPAFSIEAAVNEYTIQRGVMVVSAANLEAVAHVTNPAFKDAQIATVAATEADDEEAPETTEAEQAAEDEPQEIIVETENTAPAADEVTASAVVQAAAPVAFTKPRSPIVDGISYLDHSIKAAMGNDDSKMYVRAADDDTSTNTGLTLPQHLNEFVTNTISDRPAINAVRREALVSSGMSFTIPKLGTAPTVADTDENASPSETGMTSDYLTISINKYAGRNDVSWELLDRSSPEFLSLLLSQMNDAYAKATDQALLAQFVAQGTASTGVAATAVGFTSFVGTESAALYQATKKKARNVVANTAVWGGLMGAVDGSNRPLYTAYNVQNAPGALAPGAAEGNVQGLSLFVDPYITATTWADDSAFIIAPDCVSVYESPTTRLQVNLLETGQVRIALYGYMAIAVKQADGIRRLNIS